MTYKHFLSLCLVACLLIITAACGNSENDEQADEAKQTENDQTEQNEADDTEVEDEDQADNETEDNDDNTDENDAADLPLTQLLPYKEGYTWKYNGAVEYGHRMHLNSIEETDAKATYEVDGEVEDVSGGESPKDFSLSLTYTVKDNTLTQVVDSETMMDNEIPEIELIQAPLTEGNSWTQTQVNKAGQEITLESSIESVRNDGEQKIYTVLYEDVDSDYYEKREIKEGVGVLSFEYLYIFEDEAEPESMAMGYQIYYEGTGFDQGE